MWYKHAIRLAQEENSSPLPLGNCKNSFDEDGNCLLPLFDHVSDFAVVEENSIPISKDTFLKLTGSNASHEQYLYHPDRKIVMGYDSEDDTHHFYAVLQ